MSSQAGTLPAEVLLQIGGRIASSSPAALTRAAAVCRRWRQALGDESLWRRLCEKFEVATASGADVSSHDVFCAHARIHGAHLNEYALVAGCSRNLRRILDPRLANNLLPPTSEFPADAWMPDPTDENQIALALIYTTLTAGQAQSSSHRFGSVMPGLLGTFRVYSDTYSLSLIQRHLISVTGGSSSPLPMLTIFAAHPFVGEYVALVVDPASPIKGHVVRFSGHDVHPRMSVPAEAYPYIDYGPFIKWFPRFVKDVARDQAFRLERSLGPGLPDICPFEGPGTGVAVTHGVEVHVSSVFMFARSCFVYRITISRRPECVWDEVQLFSRKWVFTHRSGSVSEVSGEGVIGDYPHLTSTDPSYQYRSYSAGGRSHDVVDDPVVAMEGEFSFYRGSIIEAQAASRPPFAVQVPRVEFVLPQSWSKN